MKESIWGNVLKSEDLSGVIINPIVFSWQKELILLHGRLTILTDTNKNGQEDTDVIYIDKACWQSSEGIRITTKIGKANGIITVYGRGRGCLLFTMNS